MNTKTLLVRTSGLIQEYNSLLLSADPHTAEDILSTLNHLQYLHRVLAAKAHYGSQPVNINAPRRAAPQHTWLPETAQVVYGD